MYEWVHGFADLIGCQVEVHHGQTTDLHYGWVALADPESHRRFVHDDLWKTQSDPRIAVGELSLIQDLELEDMLENHKVAGFAIERDERKQNGQILSVRLCYRFVCLGDHDKALNLDIGLREGSPWGRNGAPVGWEPPASVKATQAHLFPFRHSLYPLPDPIIIPVTLPKITSITKTLVPGQDEISDRQVAIRPTSGLPSPILISNLASSPTRPLSPPTQSHQSSSSTHPSSHMPDQEHATHQPALRMVYSYHSHPQPVTEGSHTIQSAQQNSDRGSGGLEKSRNNQGRGGSRVPHNRDRDVPVGDTQRYRGMRGRRRESGRAPRSGSDSTPVARLYEGINATVSAGSKAAGLGYGDGQALPMRRIDSTDPSVIKQKTRDIYNEISENVMEAVRRARDDFGDTPRSLERNRLAMQNRRIDGIGPVGEGAGDIVQSDIVDRGSRDTPSDSATSSLGASGSL